jgi:anti-anti-sigma regulatory factor
MASNFRISVHRSNTCLYLSLSGDFDGSSAYQLLRVLKNHGKGVSKIFVHTSSLREVSSFGQNTFLNNLDILALEPVSIIFTGDRAGKMSRR